MAITEDTRNDLYQGLAEALGKQRATTLMEHLPPGGWGDVATKQDLHLLRTEMDMRFIEVRSDMDVRFIEVRTQFADLRTDLHNTLRVHLLAMIATMLTALGVVTGLMR
ncbi:MAG: hypothetical protein KY443_02350 [Actinobacteria bacterium]|nr:hypothetical protein [Actinomycetota bacterium]